MAIKHASSKSIQSSTSYASVRRFIPAWRTPSLDAQRWRSVVRNQPVAMICRDRLISYVQSLQWEVRARQPTDGGEYDKEADYYTYLLQTAGGMGFDWLIDVTLQDALDLPVGGNIEVVRWEPGQSPFKNPHPDGHVAGLVHIDGGTLSPTYSDSHPMVQQVGVDTVYFSRKQIGRIIFSPRPELELNGLGMPPPERIYLALNMLYQGDRYYAQLLMDIPEAGILDLGDMSRESADAWLKGLRSLLEDNDPFKVPVLYEHDSPAKFIPFGRPPTDLLFDNVTEKYARLTAAGYWLTLSDIGLESDSSLAGQIRRERAARLTGFGVVKEKVRNLMNWILPPYLEFTWVEKDEEAMVAKGKAALVMAQAVGKMIDAGLITAAAAQNMLKKDGIITVEVADASNVTQDPNQPQDGLISQNTAAIMGNVPAEQGGRGDIIPTQTKSLTASPELTGVPSNNMTYSEIDELAGVTLEWYYDGAGESLGMRIYDNQSAIATRMAVMDKLSNRTGLKRAQVGTILDGIDSGTIQVAGRHLPDISGDAGKVVLAAANYSQDELLAAGVEKLVLYRAFPVDARDEPPTLNEQVTVDMSGIDTWTINKDVAILAAESIESGMVVEMIVPPSMVVSTGKTGFGDVRFGDVSVDMTGNDVGTCYFLSSMFEAA